MINNTKVVLVHPDKQHSFKTAKALIESGILDKYITTVYDRPHSLTRLCTKLTKGVFRTKLKAHRSLDIPDEKVIQYTEFLSLILFILVRFDKNKKMYSVLKAYRDRAFNKKVAKYCKKNNITAVISFDVVSAQLYEALGDQGIIKILDMSAPYFPEMCSIFENECKKYPSSSLTELLKTPLFTYWKKQNAYEIKHADFFLTASDFTSQTLMKQGVCRNKIYKCVYGLNKDIFNSDDRAENNSKQLYCVYVGNINEQKGCRYLFDVIKKAKFRFGDDIGFTIVGAFNPELVFIKEVKDFCRFTGHILQSELKEILSKSDVMIFPSLCDGFGFSVLEAMACGVVPICSKNAGVSDIICDGENGFVVDVADSDEIFERLVKLYEDRTLLIQMSENAYKSTQNILWDNYYRDINFSISDILKKRTCEKLEIKNHKGRSV